LINQLFTYNANTYLSPCFKFKNWPGNSWRQIEPRKPLLYRISIFLLSTSFHIHQLHQLESWYNPTYLEHGCSFVNRWRLLYIGRPSSWVGSNDCSEEFSNSGKCSDTFLYICYIERALCTNNCTTFEQDLFICK